MLFVDVFGDDVKSKKGKLLGFKLSNLFEKTLTGVEKMFPLTQVDDLDVLRHLIDEAISAKRSSDLLGADADMLGGDGGANLLAMKFASKAAARTSELFARAQLICEGRGLDLSNEIKFIEVANSINDVRP